MYKIVQFEEIRLVTELNKIKYYYCKQSKLPRKSSCTLELNLES
jgi:hypothetical protein